MLRKTSAALFFIAILPILILSGCERKEKIEETYISDLEREYQDTEIITPDVKIETNISDIIVEIPAEIVVEDMLILKEPREPIKPKIEKKKTVYKNPYPWVDTVDSKEIKKTRDLIAREKYNRALAYLNTLDIENLTDSDPGHLYQFKGIICYFLVVEDSNRFAEAIKYFEKAYNTTKIKKFEPLSLLWLGMLYEQYSYNKEELETAIELLDKVITDYSETRFVNDAIFYKILVLKKLKKEPSEYSDLQFSLQNDKFIDNYIYSKWHKDYVIKEIIIDKIR